MGLRGRGAGLMVSVFWPLPGLVARQRVIFGVKERIRPTRPRLLTTHISFMGGAILKLRSC